MSARLVSWYASQEQLNINLGSISKSGILESMATRKEFLSEPQRQIRFVYTPKHTSGRYQIEIWFSRYQTLIKARKFLIPRNSTGTNFKVH